ncbi:MAG: F0F1 ATP synthase subunit B [Calditrichaeota bacterium]|nr:F0F1 ATP synthase subunit B [Calditrichota bacterium]MCB9368675.1 F0F1 ATP synthase subunit B [Calditrichota bacterium]
MGLQNILNIEPGSIIWTIVTFLIVVWLVGKFGWKPIIKGLTDRENSIRTDLETAKAEREKAGALLADYKQAMANAKKEAADIIQKAQDSADKHRAEAEAEAKQQGQKLIEKARVDIERESDAAKAELSRHVAELTAKATSRLLGRVIDDKEHERLIMEALKEDR